MAALLAPQGWVTEPFELQPRDVKYAFSLPTWGNATPDPRKARWEWSPAPSDEVDEVQFHQIFPHPTRWKFKRALYRGRKPLAPLALGEYDRHGNLYPNYHGEASPTLDNSTADTDDEEEEEEWMAVEDLRAGMRVRFVVQSFGTYKEHSWANISRVLVERQEEEEEDATTVPLSRPPSFENHE